MGTTLTGTTPANTYDSLIKVTDNGPLSATAKYLSDGLGNDSALALSTGNIGIGTTSPSAKLDVSSSAATQIRVTTTSTSLEPQILMIDGSGDYISIRKEDRNILFAPQGAERMRITSAGNVGIGTNSPNAILDIQDANPQIQFTDSVNTSAYARILGTDTGSLFIDSDLGNAGASSSIIFRIDGGSEKMRIDSAGNVGIGTSAPTALLTVAGTSDLAWSASTSKLQVSRSATVARFQNYENGSASSIALQWDGGNVGIGTPSPSEVLHIKGNQRISAPTGASVTAVLDLYGNNSNAYGGSNVVKSRIESLTAGDAFGSILKFSTNDSSNALQERIRIDSSGNFFVGTTVLTDISSSGTGNEGAYIKSDGQIGLATSNDAVGIFNRKTNAGSLLVFRFNGTSVGSINVTASGAAINLGGTAAANELDDYEEGTFTASFLPAVSGTITISGTYDTWSYTKIGRKVTVNGVAVIATLSSPVGSYIRVLGLPFIVANFNGAYGFVGCTFSDSSASYAKSVIGSWHGVNTVEMSLGIDASTIGTNDEFYITATYFV